MSSPCLPGATEKYQNPQWDFLAFPLPLSPPFLTEPKTSKTVKLPMCPQRGALHPSSARCSEDTTPPVWEPDYLFARLLSTSTQSPSLLGSKAGSTFNKATMLNAHVTLKGLPGVLTHLSPDHSIAVYTQHQGATPRQHPQKPLASTEGGIWSSTKLLKASSRHGLWRC